jgi:hypothetical protein
MMNAIGRTGRSEGVGLPRALLVGLALALAAGCGSGAESANSQGAKPDVRSTSSRRADAGTQYTYEVFDVPGATRTVAGSVNDEGVAAGFYFDASGQHGFIRNRAGAITTFDIPGSVYTIGWGINDFGVLAGWFGTPSGDQHGFLRKPDGTIQVLDFEPFAGLAETYSAAINNLGEVVGGYGPTYDVGFVLRKGRYTSQPNPPGSATPPVTFPYGINDLGLTSGWFIDPAGVEHGYVLRGSSYTILDYPGASFTEVYSVNDLGQAAVNADADSECGFIYEVDTKTFDALPCVGVGSNVYGLNNVGQFSGLTFDAVLPDVWHGYIATPVRPRE